MSTRKRSWPGRIYIGRDQDGRQAYWWVGRFGTKRERDDAVAEARTTKPWLNAGQLQAAEMTCRQWADRMLDRMENGALRRRDGSPYKRSTIDTARTALKTFVAEFGDRDPDTIDRVEAEDWAPTVPSGVVAIVVQLMNQLEHAEVIHRN